MIVNQFHVKCIRIFKAENDSSVCPHANRPKPFQIALERVEAIAGERKLVRGSSFIENGQDFLNRVREIGPDSASVVAFVQPPEAPVLEAPDHCIVVYTDYCQLSLGAAAVRKATLALAEAQNK